ncbi:MAG TPA: CocE/NonD family hydrolase [Steroidobacteraceae bacterium]|jgi:hypothetical protein|nr:CocE/NonD family hydrolase [Steroidobacteraceae bacterium]
MRAARLLVAVLLLAAAAAAQSAPQFDFRAPQNASDPAVPAVMRDLAERLLPVYQEPDPDRYLANLSTLQMVAGNYGAADVSRQSLRDRRRRQDTGRPIGRGAIFDLYAYAKALETENKMSFGDAFTRAFREVIGRLGDHDAYAVTHWLESPPSIYRDAFQKALDQQRASDSIDEADAVELLGKYLAFNAYRSFGPLVDGLATADDRRRYVAEEQVLIKTPAGATIAAVVVRPNTDSKLPTLLEFTIYDAGNAARECAAHGYVGVVAFTRGERTKGQDVLPYQRDGEDARAVINWIAKQPWSDGRVGMYGERYSGFTPWAAAKHMPAALKAIATSAPTAPGIDVPMDGNVFQNSAYRWSSYVTNTKPGDEKKYYDDALWHALDQKYYSSGRRYRDMGRLFGKSNPIFLRWLNHPSYDRYWQSMIPYRAEFAHVDIPVLTIAGYYAGSEVGALYYYNQHHKYDPKADHTLLIGPYDDAVMERGPLANLQGYAVDSSAMIDVREIRYQWFDSVFKHAPKPAILKDGINYEVMGGNEWRHAPSVAAMASSSMRFYLDPAVSGDGRRLATRKGPAGAFVREVTNFKDRRDATWVPSTDLISRSLAIHNDTMFVSDPLPKATVLSGFFTLKLDFTVNKQDMDLNIMLYELQANGDYMRLYSPIEEVRASYVKDRVHRHLLGAGERQELTIRSERMTSRLLQQGSRLVMVLGINKRPDREINYGAGDDVSEETMADAGSPPLKARWYADSYLEIPVAK